MNVDHTCGVNVDSWKMFNGSVGKFKFAANQANLTGIGLAFGALISCLLAAQWKLRMIKSVRQVWAAVLGGLLMGIGARIAPGCNIGAMFSTIPAFSLSGWIFLVFVFLGAVVGGKSLTKWFLPPVSHERRERWKQPSPKQRRRNRIIQMVIGIVLILCWLIFAAMVKEEAPSAGLILFTGLGLGYTMQRSRLCFCAAYRDPALTGSTKMTKALLVALGVSTIGFAGVHIARYGIDLSKIPEAGLGSPIGLHLVIGAFIFGVGAVWAGGCASGTFIRVGEDYERRLRFFNSRSLRLRRSRVRLSVRPSRARAASVWTRAAPASSCRHSASTARLRKAAALRPGGRAGSPGLPVMDKRRRRASAALPSLKKSTALT
jgi:uncharacterized membrane protein YedE/YeeE